MKEYAKEYHDNEGFKRGKIYRMLRAGVMDCHASGGWPVGGRWQRFWTAAGGENRVNEYLKAGILGK
jgi:hypothetical protein